MKKLEEILLDYAEQHQNELFSLLSDLIRFDSQNFITSGREKDCAIFIRQLYEKLGLATSFYSPDEIPGIAEHPGYLPGRGLASRPNVNGVLPGADPKPAVMLAAHIDTMPVGDRKKWMDDPFGGVIRDGKIYGLGAGDNKCGIAAAIFALQVLRAADVRLQKTVVLTSYVDEEYGGGDGTLAACLRYPCDVYVNLDGGNYEMWTASLGGGGYEIEIKTDFTTDTASYAVDALFEVKKELEALGERCRAELHANPLFTGTDMERSVLRLAEFTCGSFGSNLDAGSLKFVLYTTRSREEIERELGAILQKLGPYFAERRLSTKGFVPTTRFFEYHETQDLSGSVAVMTKAAEDAAGRAVKTTGACLSDLSLFLAYGSKESFNFGIIGDFAAEGGAHQPNERVDCDEFLRLAKAVILFLIRYCGVAESSVSSAIK